MTWMKRPHAAPISTFQVYEDYFRVVVICDFGQNSGKSIRRKRDEPVCDPHFHGCIRTKDCPCSVCELFEVPSMAVIAGFRKNALKDTYFQLLK
jgi:hypothetical protein